MLRGIATWQTIGAEEFIPYCLALLAQAYGKSGQPDEGLRQLAGALTQVDKTEERFYETELHRLKGELTLQQERERATDNGQQAKATDPQSPMLDAQGEAEACFHKALEIARHQQAKSVELRVAMSLARLWQRQGKVTDARELLEGIYGWFTEGFDTKDLREAEALLRSLGSTVDRTRSRQQTTENEQQAEEKRQKAMQVEDLRLKASEPPPSFPSSLQPAASSSSQDSGLSPFVGVSPRRGVLDRHLRWYDLSHSRYPGHALPRAIADAPT